MQKEIIIILGILGILSVLFLFFIYLGRISNKVRDFFWFCSGVNVSLLKKCPSDHNRYVNIGATIFFTALLAWISMGYALYSIFGALWSSAAFGLIWCLMIFTLDRTIVSSMQKPSKEITIRDFDFWREILFAVIRLAVAIIISLVIMKPLEIKIFEDRLIAEIKNMNDDQAKLDSLATELKYGVGGLAKEIDQARADKNELEVQLGQEPLTPRYQSLKKEYDNCTRTFGEIQGRNNSEISKNKAVIEEVKGKDFSEIEIDGVIKRLLTREGKRKIDALNEKNKLLRNEISAKSKECAKIREDMRKEIDEYQSQIKQNLEDARKRITENEVAKDSAKVKANKQAVEDADIRTKSFRGTLVTQIEALGRLTSKNTSEGKTMWWTSFFIMLIFIAIETAPLLAKLIAKRGDYDELVDMEKYKNWVRHQYAKSKINAEINRGLEEIKAIDEKSRKVVEARENAFVEMSSQKIKLQLQKELENNEALLTMISEAQKEIAALVVQQWKEQELQKLNNQSQSNGVQNHVPTTPSV